MRIETYSFECPTENNPEIKVGMILFIEVLEGEGKGKYKGEVTKSFINENKNWEVEATIL